MFGTGFTVCTVLPETGGERDKFVFVSGIGCSSRFPYYINTYGFHGLHGRGAAIATGIKLANPELHVWEATGDGDCLAIGGNHLIHLLRRNININLILFNNRVYGLTKGQYSPTTAKGKVTKTSPDGSLEEPFLPAELVMGSKATFFARAIDTNPKMMKDVLLEASKHTGTSFVEILQNCVIFADQVHKDITSKDSIEENTIYLEHGKPLIFGKERDKGIMLVGSDLKVVSIGKNGITENDLLVHDTKSKNNTVNYLLSRMMLPEFPVAMGVIRSHDSVAYETLMAEQIEHVKKKSAIQCVDDLLNSGNTFEMNESN